MQKIVTIEEMIRIEKAAEAAGHSYAQMMERAGKSLADALLARISGIKDKHVLVLAGSGNNGGDGLVAARWLAEAGATLAIYLTKDRSEDDPYLAALRDLGILIAVGEQDQRSRVLKLQLGRADVVVDAVLGTGFKLPLKGIARQVLKVAKQSRTRPYVVAVDCPSGLNCDTGEIAKETLAADLTVTLAAAKPGLFLFPGAEYVGELVVGDIGLPPDQEELASIKTELVTAESARQWLPARPISAHKGTFGRALIVAGSIHYPGAAALAGRAAYLAGAGLVTLAVPATVQNMIAGGLPECTWLPLAETLDEATADILAVEWERTQALLLGPGFGLKSTTASFLRALIGAGTPLPPAVVDADGLKLMARVEGWESMLPQGSVLTPHPGEMSVLTGIPTEEIQEHRSELATEKAAEWGHIVVLKGAFTVIAHPDGRSALIPIATPALARAGTGDVLAGLLVGYRAQGLPGFEASILGCYIHARAGLLAAQAIGTAASVLAGDVAAAVPRAIAELEHSPPAN
ncbi:MAG: NAD(P)H-hydrate dehydratase [Chloroflexi bacterium]|nr:MAG: NAD(P)H-hydrate dehydratase [Chloroflexota bacterium]